MIKEALQYVVGLSEPTINEIDGRQYSDKPLVRIDYIPKAKAIKMARLTLFTEKGAGFCLLRYDERRSNDHIGRYGAERGKTHS